ncbi:protein kinase domain containing protein, partial [Entamoeba invadens IP1]
YQKFSLAGNLTIESIEMNNPPIVVWDSNYLHLNKNMPNRVDFFITNPQNNINCFDVFSLPDITILDINTADDHYGSNDFPLQFENGTANLLSNKRLIRFCPNGRNLNSTVKCILKQNLYVEKYSNTFSYAFDFPHCPCDDENTICELYLFNGIQSNTFYFGNIKTTHTSLFVDKNTTLQDVNSFGTINLKDDIFLNVGGNIDQTTFAFSIGSMTISNPTHQQNQFIYNSQKQELFCSNVVKLTIELKQNIDTLKINCTGTISFILLNSNLFIYITKEVKEIQNLLFVETVDQKIEIIMSLESDGTLVSNNKVDNCVLMKINSDNSKCLKCNSQTRLLNGICLNITSNCQRFNSENICELCKNGYYLDDDFECQPFQNGCVIGDKNTCYKCSNDKVLDKNGNCISNINCIVSNGNSCIKCSSGDMKKECNNCGDDNCYFCENEMCSICFKNQFLNELGFCVNDGISHVIGNKVLYCTD